MKKNLPQGGNQLINFAYGTPAISMLLSHFFLGEPMYITSILGLALILGGSSSRCISPTKEKTGKEMVL